MNGLKMGQKILTKSKCECCLCNNDIPTLSRNELIEKGYSGAIDNFTKKQVIFCPKHSSKEIADFIVKNRIGQKKLK